ncbi:DNA translocase FtsK 4TM domain-containing protein, partial [Pelagibacteraceae bacterium]|nr:DNA translocase FtsK 4TM domain-containing protein [Pelagibacteraceae bacterium]
MFKYGSFRKFVVKFSAGIGLFGFGLIYLISLYSFSQNDPGFNQLNYNINNYKIENLLGFFGAHLSSYSLIFIGTLSYLLAFFITLEGGKLFLGITSRLIFFKFLSNFIGIVI